MKDKIFGVLQRVGRSFMLPIAILPVAGLLLGIGSSFTNETTIATYGSVSSFVGGPGQAWQTGFGWVYMAAVQVTTLFLLYGIMGKKMALVSR